MADRYGVSRRGDGDFEEEDVWSFVQEGCEDSSPQMRKPFKEHYSSSSSSSAWRLSSSTAPRMIRRTNEGNKVVQQSSAPVNIPDWSKIYGRKNANLIGSSSKSRNGCSWVGDDDDGGAISNGHVVYKGHHGDDVVVVDDDDDDTEDDMVPPHEWLAKKLARSQITSFSVCEGIGRTLKGRDLSKVRNAILTKTGFLE